MKYYNFITIIIVEFLLCNSCLTVSLLITILWFYWIPLKGFWNSFEHLWNSLKQLKPQVSLSVYLYVHFVQFCYFRFHWQCNVCSHYTCVEITDTETWHLKPSKTSLDLLCFTSRTSKLSMIPSWQYILYLHILHVIHIFTLVRLWWYWNMFETDLIFIHKYLTLKCIPQFWSELWMMYIIIKW